MLFNEDSLQMLLDKSYANYTSRLKPISQTPRHNLIKVLSAIDAGIQHQNLGDLTYLSNQLFPDTASSEFLRLHWSDRVIPLYATTAVGTVIQGGVSGAAVPLGLVYASSSGKRYFTTSASIIGADGLTNIQVRASEAGSSLNLDAKQDLRVISSLTAGLNSKATTADDGIAGGVDGETDEEYLTRVLRYLRNSTRYGKQGDFAAWAVDSTAEVTMAFEIKNFGIFGALLIQVVGGNQTDGVKQVVNLDEVTSYIQQHQPPVRFTVRTPELIPLIPQIKLLPQEDTTENRSLIKNRLEVFLSIRAKPGVGFTEGLLESIIVDGVIISEAQLTIEGGNLETTILQYPILGDITWL